MKDSNLEDIKMNNGFKIPDGYFENFENKIMNQIENEEPKVISQPQSEIKRDPRPVDPIDEEDDEDWGAVPAFLRRSKLK